MKLSASIGGHSDRKGRKHFRTSHTNYLAAESENVRAQKTLPPNLENEIQLRINLRKHDAISVDLKVSLGLLRLPARKPMT
jgi:hypothetical protein